MTLIDHHRIDCNHKCYVYSHRIKGVRHEIKIVSHSPDKAIAKAWEYVKQAYKKIK